MSDTAKKALVLLLCALLGFIIGRATQSGKVVTEWKEGAKTEGSIVPPEPVVIRVPDSIKYITVYKERPSDTTDSADITAPEPPPQIDTAASLAATVKDWNLERIYAGTLFRSDTLGTLNYSAKVQYNTLTSLAWDYTPKIKSITTTKTPAFRPFVTVRANTFEQMSVGGGILFKNTGFEASYIKDFKAQKNGLGIGFIVCF